MDSSFIETKAGYKVSQTAFGLDVYDDKENFLFELAGKTLSDYIYNGLIDTNMIDNDIEDEEDTRNILNRLDYPYIF
jgi:hypothetical protein